MATFLFNQHVFGPIKSRRLGSSLGINLLSVHQKVCNFNCVYCECGLTNKLIRGDELFAQKDELLQKLKERLLDCLEKNVPIDTITFAGNGEPTMHPQFLSIVQAVIRLRDLHFPRAKIAVLTNGYTLNKSRVGKALSIVDQAIVKFDAGNDELLQLIDQPKGRLTIHQLMRNLRGFKGDLIIQTMFLKGNVKGREFDNSEGIHLENWIRRVVSLAPVQVMLYSLDRDTPVESLVKVKKEVLDQISLRLNQYNIKTRVV